jgi:replicative DNA helicase
MGDLTLELTLLSLILRDNSVLEQLNGLEPEDLSDRQHQVALATALSLREQDRTVNPVSMRSLLGLSGETAAHDIVGAAQAFSVDGSLPPVADVVRSLREHSFRRQMHKMGDRLKALASDPTVPPADAIAELMTAGDAVLAAARPQGKTMYTLNEAADRFLMSLQDQSSRSYIQTGYANLDDLTGGFPRAELVLLGGQTSMGKTALAVAVGLRVASRGKTGVLYFSQEMPNDSFMARVASICFWKRNERALPYTNIKPGRVPEEHHEALVRETINKTKTVPMIIEYRRGLTLTEMSSAIRIARQELLRSGHSLDLVIVDHIGLMQAPQRKNSNRTNEISEISDGLCRIAKAEDIAMFALSQLNREVARQEDPRPSLHHLRDSGSLEQDASVVMFVFREIYQLERKTRAGEELTQMEQADWIAGRNKLEINVAKNRNGVTGAVELFVDMPSNIVRDQ